jgi:hypothetical protein
MVSGQDTTDTGETRNETISLVSHKALLFGELSAKAAGTEAFDDPIMHTYFLHYIYGAIESLAKHPDLPEQLDDEGRVNAMGHALMTFEDTTREDVMGTLKMLHRATDEPALKIRAEGGKAAESWDWGANNDAVFRFAELMKDKGNFPDEVESSAPLENPPTDSLPDVH